MELENTASAALADLAAAAASLEQGVAVLPWGDFRDRGSALIAETRDVADQVRYLGPTGDFSDPLARAAVLENRFIELFRGTQSDFLLRAQYQLNAAREALAAHERSRLASVPSVDPAPSRSQQPSESTVPAPRRVLITSQRVTSPSRPVENAQSPTVPLSDLADAALKSLTNAEQLEVLYNLSAEQADLVRRRLPRVVSDVRFAVEQVASASTMAERARNRDRLVAALEQLPPAMRQIGDVKALVSWFDEAVKRPLSIRVSDSRSNASKENGIS